MLQGLFCIFRNNADEPQQFGCA